MKPHEERVVQEQKELQEKIDKLSSFLNVSPVQSLDQRQHLLLKVQLKVMETYNGILQMRIQLFDK